MVGLIFTPSFCTVPTHEDFSKLYLTLKIPIQPTTHNHGIRKKKVCRFSRFKLLPALSRKKPPAFGSKLELRDLISMAKYIYLVFIRRSAYTPKALFRRKDFLSVGAFALIWVRLSRSGMSSPVVVGLSSGAPPTTSLGNICTCTSLVWECGFSSTPHHDDFDSATKADMRLISYIDNPSHPTNYRRAESTLHDFSPSF